MAGAGSRFHQAGYSLPKPLIKVNGKTMIRLSVDTLKLKRVDANFIFVVRKYQEEHHNTLVREELNDIDPDCKIVEVEELTEGSACTCILAKEYINNDTPLFIYNCDQVFNFSETTKNNILESILDDEQGGAVVTWFDENPKNSFCEVDSNNICYNFTEKEPVSNNALIGFHYFRTGREFVDAAYKMIMSGKKFNNEYYIAPVYNNLNNIKNIHIERNECYLIGTPDDLQIYKDLPKVKNILFDLDGVLVDTVSNHTRALKEAVRVNGIPPEFIDYVPENLPTVEKLACLKDTFTKLDIEEYKILNIIEKKNSLLDELVEKSTFPETSDKFDMFDFIEQQGINFYIVTNSSKRSVYSLFKKLGWWERLKHKFICSNDSGRGKPYAEPYVRAILKYGLDVKGTVVIEDSEEGKQSAESCGLKVTKVNNPTETNINLIDKILRESKNGNL